MPSQRGLICNVCQPLKVPRLLLTESESNCLGTTTIVPETASWTFASTIPDLIFKRQVKNSLGSY